MKAVLSLLAAAALVASVCAMPTYEEWAEMNEAENLRQARFRTRNVAAQVLRANSETMAEALPSMDVNASTKAACEEWKEMYITMCHTFNYAVKSSCTDMMKWILHHNRCPDLKF